MFACVFVPVTSTVTSSGGGVEPSHPPACCHTVSRKSHRRSQTLCHRPKIPYSFSSHPSVCICQSLLMSICCLSKFHGHVQPVSLYCTALLNAHLWCWHTEHVHGHSWALEFPLMKQTIIIIIFLFGTKLHDINVTQTQSLLFFYVVGFKIKILSFYYNYY